MAADHSTTHFERFQLPRSFDVDTVLLDERYRDSQRAVHPDRFVNASDQERRLSMQQATLLNEGYHVLKDPLQRGRYLLELQGYNLDDEQLTTSDTAFLMEQMELREALGEVREADDVFATLTGLMGRIDDDIDSLVGELQQAFDGSDAVDADRAADCLTKMQFYRKLKNEALELEVELEDGLL
jgi:molecular chaperone HscB